VASYRLSRRAWKKLADEVTPVASLLRTFYPDACRLQFSLSSEPPDAWLWLAQRERPIGLEVTIALGTERHHLAHDMMQMGIGKGFLGISDDAPRSAFAHALRRPRITHSTKHSFLALIDGIARCLQRKDHPKFRGYILLIQAPLRALPRHHWQALKNRLERRARKLPFAEVYVVKDRGMRPEGIRLK
jgi:hypothetical protein